MLNTSIKLRQIREEQNLTQQQFADLIGRSRSTVAAWESGRKEPGREALKVIAKAFNLSIEYIIDKDTNSISTLARGMEEVTLIELFRQADEDTKKSILHLLTFQKK